MKNNPDGDVYGSECVRINAAVDRHGFEFEIQECIEYGVMVPGTSEYVIGCTACQAPYLTVAGNCVANLGQTKSTCQIINCEYCISSNVCGQCA